MNKVEIFYKKVIEAVCKECGTDPVMMFSNNKERNVDARGLLIVILTERKFSESLISDLTGLTQQAVNRLKNIYPDRINRSYFLRGGFKLHKGGISWFVIISTKKQLNYIQYFFEIIYLCVKQKSLLPQ